MANASTSDRSFLDKLNRPVTLAEASEGSGVKARTIQFWTLNGVVECTPETRHGGPGVRRKYAITEVAIAAIIGKFADTAVSVGGLRGIASSMRSSFKENMVLPTKEGDFSFFLESINGNNVYIIIKTYGGERWDVNWGISANINELSIEETVDISSHNSWGAVFAFNASEIFRSIRSIIGAS
ncbi:MerR family transcriptional regulator [Azospirillum sp. TSH58]|uniref:MerR family transcriptional regulator n=1 Tax=Azospirillum sp. TSH58 TaxID=664962 RepID=UPI0011B23A7E|nr:MerR family transcriptional regulator [Azospirillum sp. TSH58]